MDELARVSEQIEGLALETLQDDPFFGGAAAELRGLCLYLTLDLDASAAAWSLLGA